MVPRIADLYAALPSITGKMELEYEGELHGAGKIARELISSASAGLTYREPGREVRMWRRSWLTSRRGGPFRCRKTLRPRPASRLFEVVPGLLQLVDWVGLAPMLAPHRDSGRRRASWSWKPWWPNGVSAVPTRDMPARPFKSEAGSSRSSPFHSALGPWQGSFTGPHPRSASGP